MPLAEESDIIDDREEIAETPVADQEPEGAAPVGAIDVSDDGEEGEEGAAPDKKTRRGGYRVLRETLKSEKAARARLEREIAELRGHVSAIRQQPRGEERERHDPVAARLGEISEKRELLLAQARNKELTDDQAQKLRKQWDDLDAERIRLLAGQGRREDPRDEVAERVQRHNDILGDEFPEIFADDALRLETQAELVRVRRGRPESLKFAREAARRVMARHGIGRKPAAPSDADRSRRTSVEARAGASGSREMWTPTQAQRRSALALYSHLNVSDEQKLKLWYDKVGKKNKLV